MNIIQDFIPVGRANRPGFKNPMLYVTIHNTGNSGKGANAKSHANYIKSDSAASGKISWHYTVDDKEIYQHIPDNETAFHAGDGSGDGNRKSIGIEICMNSDGDLLKATDNAAWLTAKLCKDHNIPIANVKQHNNWSGKNCPQMIREGKPYNWDTFIKKVEQNLKGDEINMDELRALEERVAELEAQIKVKYGYIDEYMPEYAREPVRTLMNEGILKGNEHGNLQLSELKLWVCTLLGRAIELFKKS